MAEFDRQVKVGLEFSDHHSMRIDEFYELFESIDELNNMSILFYNGIEYGRRRLSDFKYGRIGIKRISDNPAQITAVNKNSPLVIEIILGSIGAFLTILHIAEKIRDWKVEKEKSKLELEKLRYETREKYIEVLKKSDEYLRGLDAGEHRQLLGEIINKFDENPMKLKGIKILEEEPAGTEIRLNK